MSPASQSFSYGPPRVSSTRESPPFIAVLIDHIDLVSGGYEAQLRKAFARATSGFGYELLVMPGGVLGEPVETSARNRVFELIGPESVSGVILLAPGLSRICGPERFRHFCESFGDMPICSVGLEVANVPSITIDDRAGMRELLDHLIVQHGRREIAFVQGEPGNVDASIRFEVYREALAAHSLTYDERLVVPGTFTVASGVTAMSELLARGRSFDAVVAANDGMALGALRVLSERGVRVPGDVAVTGFDDLVLSRSGDLSLSTVRQPLGKMAELAVASIVRQIRGQDVPQCTSLPVSFVPRESCGCGLARLSRTAPHAPDVPKNPEAYLKEHRERLTLLLREATENPEASMAFSASALIEGLEDEFQGREAAFAEAVAAILRSADSKDDAAENAQICISLLSRELGRAADRSLDSIWDRARHRVLNARKELRQRVDLELMYEKIREGGERLSMVLDRASLKQALVTQLFRMQINDAFVLLCCDAGLQELESFVCLRGGEVYEPERVRFPASQLLPKGSLVRGRGGVWLALPLTADERLLGVVVLSIGAEGAVYEILRGQISAALKTCALHAEIVQETALRERSVRERGATAERMRSLSVLAGGVAHDMNNALGPLVGLSEVVQQEIELIAERYGFDAYELRADLATIRAAALRASQTIKDLLILSRQGRADKQPLDVNQLISTALAEHARGLSVRDLELEVILEPHPEPLLVLGSEPHLMRALVNLLSNASLAVQGSGRVVIGASRVVIPEALSGFELIEPGDYAVVRVSDTGTGIRSSEIPRIFEPFYTKRRPGQDHGSGLGLAIVHGVVKDHGGSVNVETRDGAGTTFSLFLPRIAHTTLRRSEPILARSGHGKVLVLDDEIVQIRTARRILGHLGYDVTTVTSGAEAFEVFASHLNATRLAGSPKPPFDLVIFDMLLNEERDGLGLLERVRELCPAQRALIVSGHAPSDRGQLAQMRGVPWLAKPYTFERLAAAVHELVFAADAN